jgi:cytochrome c-type biogenesis protein
MGWKETLQWKVGIDVNVFAEKKTWKAFGVSVLLFAVIAYGGLSAFGVTSAMFGVGGEIREVPDFEMETVNRTGIEDNFTNETGWFKLSENRGSVIILDFMAHGCGSCHYAQDEMELKIGGWQNLSGPYPVIIVSIGSWYDLETMEWLNESEPEENYFVPQWILGMGAHDSIIINETTGERGDLTEYYFAQQIPLLLVIDHQGFIVGKQNSGTPVEGWGEFDESIVLANLGNATDLRMGLKEVDRSFTGILALGLMLGILVYFSPCAFPVLPGYIGYYISLGLREEELRESGKLKGSMPNHVTGGALAGVGMLTFFAILGIVVLGLAEVVNIAGYLHRFAIFIAILLFVLGSFMLMGGTAHLLGWIDKLIVQRFSTTESDELFTPRRNMYLWGIGYAAASVDCTAAIVLPYLGYLLSGGTSAVLAGLGGIMLSVFLLMMAVTVIVGVGSKKVEAFLRKATDMIKMVGSWMMMFAGIGLLIYLTQPELVLSLL